MRKLLGCLVLLTGTAWAATPIGKILLIVAPPGSEAQLQSPSGQTRSTARSGVLELAAGSPIYRGDVLITRGNARVKIAFLEGHGNLPNALVLGANASLTLDSSASADEVRRGRRGTTLTLNQGEVRSDVRARYTGEGSEVYEIRTTNAVAGVRGTQFTVEYDASQALTRVAVHEGKVNLSSRLIVSQALVPAGSIASIKGSLAVTAPMTVPVDQKHLLTPVPELGPNLSMNEVSASNDQVAARLPPDGPVLEKATELALPQALPRAEPASQGRIYGSHFDSGSEFKKKPFDGRSAALPEMTGLAIDRSHPASDVAPVPKLRTVSGVPSIDD